MVSGRSVIFPSWCPEIRRNFGVMVSTLMRNPNQEIDWVDWVEGIEKSESIVYSMDSGIFLKRKELPIPAGSSPFFGTK